MQYMLPKKVEDTSKWTISPMPGVISTMSVKVGDKVEPGQEIAIVEAMKMYNSLVAEKGATVAEILVREGETIDVDQKLVRFE